MNINIVNITIDTPEGKLTLTMEEARSLYNSLHELFHTEPIRIPPYQWPITREPIPTTPITGPNQWPMPDHPRSDPYGPPIVTYQQKDTV